MKERKPRKKITADDLIIDKVEPAKIIKEEIIEEKNTLEKKEHKFFISDEKFSVTWEQSTNRCNSSKLYQTMEIKTESCDGSDSFVLSSDKWNFTDIDDLIYILLEFKNKYDIMKKS
jgi:hypothetical protein